MAWIRWVIGLILGVSIAYVLTVYYVRDGQLNSCHLGNRFRAATVGFMEEASKARARSGDKDVAADYARRAKIMRHAIINCEATYKAPFSWIG